MDESLVTLALGAIVNLIVALIIVRFIYYPVTQDRNYILTFVIFNTVIFFMLSMLTSVSVSVGVGFGLFAIFSVLRYRTDELPIREMTYLFTIIALPVINSLLASSDNLATLVFADLFVILVLFVMEKGWGFKFQGSQRIVYEKIELILPERRAELLADLRERTGLAINRVRIGNIDFLHDTALVTIYYDEPSEKTSA